MSTKTLSSESKPGTPSPLGTKSAIAGGGKTPVKLGPFPSKVGVEELLEILDMWEFSPATKSKLVKIIRSEANLTGPYLLRYFNPKPSKVAGAEKAMRDMIGSKYCLAVNSGTSALITSYRALGIGAGDEVIVPAYTFLATAATVASSNAIPVIIAVDDTLCMDPEAIGKAITRRTKAIAPVHMRGAPAQMDAIMDLANKKGLPVVEDTAQACGGSFRGRRLGSFGAAGCFSFGYFKILVSGEGGFITTDDEWLYTRAQSWHDSSGCWRPDRFARERQAGELFCGEGYRMSELEGAVALAQIRKADDILAGYRRAKKLIKGAIEKFPGLSFRRLTDESGDTGICLIMFLPDANKTRPVVAALQAEGVPAEAIWGPKVRNWHVYSCWEHILDRKTISADGLPWSAVPDHELPGYSTDMCPHTLDLLSRAIMIDINCNYSTEDCALIAGGINKVLHRLLK